MSKFMLTASKAVAKEGQLTFHATLSPEEFVAAGYTNKDGVQILVNPKGNKHPKGYFMAWKNSEGVAFGGAVSTKITEPGEFTNPVISIVSAYGSAEMFVLMHNRGEQVGAEVIGQFGV